MIRGAPDATGPERELGVRWSRRVVVCCLGASGREGDVEELNGAAEARIRSRRSCETPLASEVVVEDDDDDKPSV